MKIYSSHNFLKHNLFKYATFTHQTISISGLSDIQEEKKFLNEVITVFKKKGVDFITQPPTYVLFKTFPNNSIYIEFGSHKIDLTLDNETLLKNIHSRPRQYINSARHTNIQIETGQHLISICHKIIFKTLKQQKISFMTDFELHQYANILKNNIAFFAAKLNNFYQAALIVLFDETEAYYLYGGKTDDAHNSSNFILHWRAILFFKSLGLKKYNFVGARKNPVPNSRIDGIQKFKEKFGGRQVHGYLWKYNIHPWKTLLFQFLIRLRTRRKYFDIIDECRDIL